MECGRCEDVPHTVWDSHIVNRFLVLVKGAVTQCIIRLSHNE